jgi:hypothetical protein
VVNERVLCLDLVGHRADVRHGDFVGGVGFQAWTAGEVPDYIERKMGLKPLEDNALSGARKRYRKGIEAAVP